MRYSSGLVNNLMRIGIIHIDTFENNDLKYLVKNTVQELSMFFDSTIQDKFVESLQDIVDILYVVNGIRREDTEKVKYVKSLIPNARNSVSMFSLAHKYKDHTILLINPNFIVSDWESFKQDCYDIIWQSEHYNCVSIVASKTNPSGADICNSWIGRNHFISRKYGTSKSYELHCKVVANTEKFNKLQYSVFAGVSACSGGYMLSELSRFMPRYLEWVETKKWDLVQQLSFEEAIIENAQHFFTHFSEQTYYPIEQYRQIYSLMQNLYGPFEIPSTHWHELNISGAYIFGFRFVDSHQTQIDLSPGVYYKHDYKNFTSLDDLVFEITEPTTKQFERHIVLMKIARKNTNIFLK